jgi:hypothetical protein
MRTTFSDMHLLTSAPQKHDATFILNGKEWGVGKTERERERVRGRVWVERVAAWFINLIMGHVFMRV